MVEEIDNISGEARVKPNIKFKQYGEILSSFWSQLIRIMTNDAVISRLERRRCSYWRCSRCDESYLSPLVRWMHEYVVDIQDKVIINDMIFAPTIAALKNYHLIFCHNLNYHL